MHPYVASKIARQRHRERLAQADKQRLARQFRDRARASRHQREYPAPRTPGHAARIIHGLASAIARAWRGGRAHARPQVADPPAPVRQASRLVPDAIPRPRAAAPATTAASSIQPGLHPLLTQTADGQQTRHLDENRTA
jgi:hypothetical protein